MELPSNPLKYHSEPRSLLSPLDSLGRLICAYPTNIMVGAVKPSFGWNWHKQRPFPEEFKGTLVEGDKNAMQPKNYAKLLWALSRFGWQTVRMVSVDKKQLPNNRNLKFWHYAYAPLDKSFLDICSVGINPKESITVLNGPSRFYILGVSDDSVEVPLIVSNAILRGSKNAKHLPLF